MEKLILSFVMGAFGMGYFVYGKKQSKFMALISGLALIVSPYFISSPYVLAAFAAVFLLLPFLVRI